MNAPRFSRLRGIYRLARRAYAPYIPQLLMLTVLGFLGGILEGIGINAVIPLLTLVLGSSDPVTDTFSVFIQGLFTFLGIPFVPKFLLGFIVIAFVGKTLISLLLSYLQIHITMEYERETRERIFRAVLGMSWPTLLKQKLGNLETVLMIDVPNSTGLLGRITYGITLATSIAMYLLVAFSISPVVTAATFGIAVLLFLALKPLLSKVHVLSRERAATYRDTMHNASEHVGGVKSVKAFGVEGSVIADMLHLFKRIKDRTTTMQMYQQIAAQVVTPIGIAYLALIFGLAYKTPFITFASLPAVLYLIYRIFTYAQTLQGNIQTMTEVLPHLERVVEIEHEARETQESRSGERPFVFDHTLSFVNVHFSYERGAEVLKDVSFSIQKGQMIGLIGPSGAGKTTCVDLMLRLLTPGSGAILLDGVDIRDVRLSEWRRNIAYVSQDLFLINDSIRNNVRFYDDRIRDEDIEEGLRLAHAQEFVEKLPQGLDTVIGDKGLTLSAGQRQRLVIARALARKPNILILDEATSALDAESEAQIKKAIDELKGKVTIIAIAHRLSTIMDSDTLIVLENGQVVEKGEPKQLLTKKDSYFSRVTLINQ